ncbi:hypothetical protein NW757_003585 [Fusarium falciforme]|nr:hypothetical protein NW757_003585 [Fusarium falciforme]
MKATFDPAKEIEDALKRVNSKQKEVERTAQIANMEIMYGTSARVHDLTAMVSSLSAQLETANASIANLSINATNGEATTSSEKADSVKVAIASIMGPTTRTIESSAVIDLHLTQAAEQGPMAAPVAYFYCARNSAEAGRSDPDQVLRCIARQLCGDDPKEIVNENLLHKWEHVGKPRIGQGQLNIESIMGLILKTLADNPATIIIDALDELRADRRHEIFEYLDQIVKQSPNVVKVLLTSRNDGDIVCRLDTTPNVYISAQENRGDIERFIDAELDKAITQKRLLRGHVSADVQRQITFELNHRADGMFRWVSLQIQNLCDPQRMKLEEDVLHELRHLPQSLSDLYKIAFDQICQLGPWSYEMAMGALQLLLVAGRPIAWPEILHILQVSHSIIQRPISREELLDITCNFIDDDGKQECPRFAHQSVREYLETRPDFANAEANVAYMCLRQIAAPNEANTSDFQYPTLYLCDHLAATVPEQRVALRPLLQELFRPPASGGEGKQSNLFKQWRSRLITFGGDGSLCVRKTDSVGNRIQATMTASPLNVICAVGLDDILIMLKPSRSDIFGGHRERNCFMLAILLDQPRIVKAVRNLGFSVDTPSATGGTALSLAAELGKASLIRELLVCGANPNQICQISDKSCTAAEEDSEPTVQSNNRRPQTSLGFHVSRNGRREIQSPFHYKEEKKPVLYVAMSNENAATCVGALCEFGANVNTRTSSNTTALQNCLEYGNLRVMFQVFGILLKAGADASALLESERTIAHVVAAMGHCELIRQLLDIGTDCSSRDVFQQSPLELAIRYGHTETAELLESKTNRSQFFVKSLGSFYIRARLWKQQPTTGFHRSRLPTTLSTTKRTSVYFEREF